MTAAETMVSLQEAVGSAGPRKDLGSALGPGASVKWALVLAGGQVQSGLAP